jgi:peptidoglycan hydrolase-like protein with peptidoglycan-binding domain
MGRWFGFSTARWAGLATVILAASAPVFAGGQAYAGSGDPVPAVSVPLAVDVVPSYQAQRSCDPAAKPGVEAYARLLLTTYRQGRNGGIVRGCGTGASSEHKEGRAFDWMLSVDVPAEKAAGDALTSWLTGPDDTGAVGGNARRLGVMYVIWNRRTWSTYRAGEGWRPYTGVSPHTDHVHTSFSWDGAMQRTSWWTGVAAVDEDKGPCAVYAGQPAPVWTARRTTPCPGGLPAPPVSPHALVWPGTSNSEVRLAQLRLRVPADGVFGSGTRARLFDWQRATGLPVTGVLDKASWARLDPPGDNGPSPSVTTPPVTAPPTPTPTPTPSTPAPSTATPTPSTPTSRPTASTPTTTGPASTAPTPPTTPTTPTPTPPTRSTTPTSTPTRSTTPTPTASGPATPKPPTATALTPYKNVVLRPRARGTAVKMLQRGLGMHGPYGTFDAATERTVRNFQTARHLPRTGVVNRATWTAVEKTAYPLRSYRSTVLRSGNRGTAVKVLQRALKLPQDGRFGTRTTTAVRTTQRKARLRVTGVVTGPTWDAIERTAYPFGVRRW